MLKAVIYVFTTHNQRPALSHELLALHKTSVAPIQALSNSKVWTESQPATSDMRMTISANARTSRVSQIGMSDELERVARARWWLRRWWRSVAAGQTLICKVQLGAELQNGF